MGRTTGPTAGEINGCQSITRTFLDGSKITTIEYAVVPTLGEQAFAEEGDSGALVFGADSRKFLIWGGPKAPVDGPPQNISVSQVVYVTPLKAVIDDIQRTLALTHPGVKFEVELL